MSLLRVGIIGATGYTGSELVRLLAAHPRVEIAALTSRSEAGRPAGAVHPALQDVVELTLTEADRIADFDLDALFLALPHRTSMEFVAAQPQDGPPIIDLSGDFRLADAAIYEAWYETPHVATAALAGAVFGLPELFRDRIPGARLVANPGCYPTAAVLALAPLVRRGLVATEGLVVDAKSGVTGAGATAKPQTHFPDVFGDFRAYGVSRHRHTPEIEQALGRVAGAGVQVLFQPHLLPVDRGILATCYARPAAGLDPDRLQAAYHEDYADEPFVRLREAPPATKHVRGSNFCDVHAVLDERTGLVIAFAAIDNLVKGAAGQAVQNLNLLCDWPETTGLNQGPLCP
jgi:N-acetyl-gamma-glutamyl-phosphate reductase